MTADNGACIWGNLRFYHLLSISTSILSFKLKFPNLPPSNENKDVNTSKIILGMREVLVQNGKEDESDEENEDDKLIGGRLISNRSIPNLVAAVENEERLIDSKLSSSIDINSSSSLLAHREMSSSQVDFFKMLDDKIESGPDYDENNEKERLLECARMRQLLMEWERAKQKRLPRSASTTHQVVQTVQQPRKSRFSMPHINGDVHKQFPYPVYTLRQHVQYAPNINNNTNISNTSHNNSQNQYTLSNSVVMYDPSRGQYYTELA
ncbi:hypothetical protein V9T40_001305 [Parthenolecanium corni]|uniref:Uncharacterized protein n=1 Tax=Parthenolecanium corni TaxID=536013 RepID=A0AAN9Y191_9HEMI